MVCREIPVRPEERNIDIGALVARHLGDELAGDGAERHAEMTMPEGVKDIVQRLAEIMRDQKLDEKAGLKILAKERGLSKSEAYRELQRRKTR